MALDWQVSGIKDYETVCWHGDEINPVTRQLIFATVPVGIGRITEKNAGEFYARITAMQRVQGEGWIMQRESMDAEWVSRYITPAEVRAHIGLVTNASPLSRSKFLSSQVTGNMDELVRAFEKEAAT